MTALLKEELYLTPEEYLEFEEASEIKHEYFNGYVQAMAGASRAHNRIARSILSALDAQLDGKTCEPFGSDMRMYIHLPEETFYYYPDVTVDCSGKDTTYAEEPTVIFEVLSAATGRNDRGDKLINYLNLPSMKVYVIVDQRRVHVTAHRRSPDGTWKKEIMTDLEATLLIPEIGCTIPLCTMYRRVSFESQD